MRCGGGASLSLGDVDVAAAAAAFEEEEEEEEERRGPINGK